MPPTGIHAPRCLFTRLRLFTTAMQTCTMPVPVDHADGDTRCKAPAQRPRFIQGLRVENAGSCKSYWALRLLRRQGEASAHVRVATVTE
jgi:hypothetical protein